MSTPDATTVGEPGWPARAATIAWPAGWHVTAVDETGSTNTDLLDAARAGAPDRTVLAAAHQTAGRGRLDRRWDAPAGANLLVSFLFRDVHADAHVLVQRVALAAADAVEAVAGVVPQLKWPNDLLLDGRKLAGVLAQLGMPGPGVADTHVVVGLGLNVGWAPPDAASLAESAAGAAVHPLDLLRALLGALDALPADVHGRYRDRLATLGQEVRVTLPGGGLLDGRAVDVEHDGRLVVVDAAGVAHRLAVGDVVHLRRA